MNSLSESKRVHHRGVGVPAMAVRKRPVRVWVLALAGLPLLLLSVAIAVVSMVVAGLWVVGTPRRGKPPPRI